MVPASPVRRPVSVLDRTLGVLGELLITAGVVVLLFLAWQLWWTDVLSARAGAQVSSQLSKSWPEESSGAGDSANPPVGAEPSPGQAFGIVHVPKFGADWQPRPVLQGTDDDVLQEGVGHYLGTALPGQVGNVALAGHRVTYGRPLFGIDTLQPGDAVVVETAEGWYTYRVSGHEIVRPSQVEVIAAVPGQSAAAPTERLLTLTACHPRYSAKQRYIVHATYESWQPRSAGEPGSLRP